MSTCTTLALGKWENPLYFEARCSRCLDVIGTLHYRELYAAINSAAYRGGIMCPKCRVQSCWFCGLDLKQIKYPNKHIGRVMLDNFDRPIFTEYVQMCKLCYCDNWEVITDEVPFDGDSSACPVVHNSTPVKNDV